MIGRTLSHYEITAKLGEGGMGEVWRATDTSLNREVAVKVLPAEMAADPERLERFKREAQAIAALNHPNIVTVHSVEKEDGVSLLTMELVEGNSLDQIQPAGGFELDRLFPLAIQIADALAAAHEKGVIHRDLKPANVMVTEDGRVKVLDFGLAKLAEAEEENAETQLMTQAGMVIGTVPYMSPEQVQAKPIDRRSDIFSLGILLYEMATGKRPFQGDNAASVISAVLKDQPPAVTELKSKLPNHLGRIVRRCLEKLPQRRYQSAREIQLELEGLEGELKLAASVSTSAPGSLHVADALPESVVSAPANRGDPSAGRWFATITAAVIAGALATVATYAVLSRNRAPAPSPPLHAEIGLPEDAGLGFGLAAVGVDNNLLALSPDGTLLVYVGRSPGGGSRLYRRDLARFDPPEPIPGTEGALHAFFSPDGGSIGFVTVDKLKRVAPNGDSLQTLAPVTTVVRGQWAGDDTIYLGAQQGRRLQHVPAGGGRLEDLHVNRDMVFLEVLPHFRSALVMLRQGISTDYADIALLDLETFETRTILEGGYDARLMTSDRLVFARGGSLLAAPFDTAEGRVAGEPVTVLREVVMDAVIGQAQFAFSDAGTMVFVRGPELSRGGVARIDRDGNQEFLRVPQNTYGVLDLDPTDRKLVLHVADVESYVWTFDIPSGRGTRLPGRRTGWPVWSNDSQMIAYRDDSDQTLRIESVGGSAAVRPAIPNEWSATVSSWSPDDRVLAISGSTQGLNQIGFLDLDDGTVAWVDNGGSLQSMAAFSPDGKWVAYSSNETGAWEVWIRSYPDGSVVRQISDGGGIETVWSPLGEIFYRRGDRWMSVAITTEPELSWSAPRQVFETDFIDTLGRSFDVSSDGQSLYVVKQPDPPDGTRLHVVTGWASRP